MLLWTAMALILFAQSWHESPRLIQWSAAIVPLLVLTVGVVTVGLPFMTTAYRDPSALNLPNCYLCDEQEYITWIPSGYGIQSAVAYIEAKITDSEVVIGTVANCNTARLMLPYSSPVQFKCYDNLDWSGVDNQNVIADITAQLKQVGHVYVLGENSAIVPPQQFPHPWCVVRNFDRPDHEYYVTLYYIGADNTPCLL
jgi:hypothetical protein